MVLYRRNRVPGGTYFFTLTLVDRSSSALVDHIGRLRDSFRTVRLRHPFASIAIVVLPDHLHAVWRLPDHDDRYAMRWRMIKAHFTRSLGVAGLTLPGRGNGERWLWARRFWEHTVRDGEDLARHVDYVHFNPVKHGLVARVADWPYSSFHREVARGALPADWGGVRGDRIRRAGE